MILPPCNHQLSPNAKERNPYPAGLWLCWLWSWWSWCLLPSCWRSRFTEGTSWAEGNPNVGAQSPQILFPVPLTRSRLRTNYRMGGEVFWNRRFNLDPETFWTLNQIGVTYPIAVQGLLLIKGTGMAGLAWCRRRLHRLVQVTDSLFRSKLQN